MHGLATSPAADGRTADAAPALEDHGPRTQAAPGAWSRSAMAGALRWADLLLLVGLYCVLAAVNLKEGVWRAELWVAAPWLVAPALTVWMAAALGAYRFQAHESGYEHAGTVAMAAVLGAVGAGLLAWPLPASAQAVTASGVFAALGLALVHAGWRALAARISRSGRFAHNVVIVGATENAERLIAANARAGEINVMGVFDDRAASGRAPEQVGGAPVLGDLEALFGWPDLPRADCIIITVTSQAAERTSHLIDRLRVLPNKVVLFLDLETFRPETADLARIADLPMAYVSGGADSVGRAALKRAEDVVLGALAAVMLAPVMAAIALAVKLDSPGPVLFRQQRHGFNNRIIQVLKFRTMRVEHCDGPTRQVVEDDPRVTRLGRFLRSTSLDELPQVFNVLRGEMSIVGPRPHAIDMKTGEVESARLVADYAHRCRVKPGITGWAQIHGSRGPVHTPEEVEERVRYDLDYIQRHNLLLDLWIVLRTVPCFLGDALRTR